MIDLSTKFNRAHTSHLAAAIKVVRRIKGENVFPKLSSLNELKLVVYTDASFGNLHGVGSCGGHIIFLSDKNDRSTPIAWHSGKVKRIVRSTLAAETVSLLARTVEAIIDLLLGSESTYRGNSGQSQSHAVNSIDTFG